jgi:MSHA biogenesis protein MshL
MAFTTVRETDSIVRARSGQIIVIGGLMQESTEQLQASTPVLGDIPGIGRLFRHTREVTRKTELVILLRPIVVDHEGVWDYALGRLDAESRGQ